MKEKQLYADSLVVFLDILGIKEEIQKSEADEKVAEYIATILHKIRGWAAFIEKGAKEKWKTEFKVHTFSDSLVISCPIVSEISFIYAAHIISAIQWDLLGSEFFVRGAISVGPHYDIEQVYFGPAFVRSYRLEQLSMWPRVIVDCSVLERLNKDAVDAALKSYLLRDQNGLCYFNYLHLINIVDFLKLEQDIEEKKKPSYDATRRYNEHKDHLLMAVAKVINTTSGWENLMLMSKYHAIAVYHNQMIDEIYQGLPEKENYKDIKPDSDSIALLNSFRNFALSRQDVEVDEVDTMLQEWNKELYEIRGSILDSKIDLAKTFRLFYPHQE